MENVCSIILKHTDDNDEAWLRKDYEASIAHCDAVLSLCEQIENREIGESMPFIGSILARRCHANWLLGRIEAAWDDTEKALLHTDRNLFQLHFPSYTAYAVRPKINAASCMQDSLRK